MKKYIQRIINFFGYKLIKVNRTDATQLDELTKIIIPKSDPVIFDVGANKGQSIERYKKIFQNPIIHSFEPNIDEIDFLKKKYIDKKNLYLNNFALGDDKGNLELNINANTGHSSFKNLIPNTTWIKERSKTLNIDSQKYTTKKTKIELTTLDDYVIKENISSIDILKIDTQGFEDKVLKGAQKFLSENKIKLIQLELIFSEIYENPLQIYDVEKTLIPNNYKLLGIANNGSLLSHYIFESDFLYISDDIYKKIKNKLP